jgi:SRSO17 transposase
MILDRDAQDRLDQYFASMGEILGNDARKASFAIYAMGLLGDAERKSVEPIAARACPDPDRLDAAHQRLLHFITRDWSDREVRLFAARHALEAMTRREKVNVWIVDDTGFLKQGKHSVGVQRQYTGSAGKITNCQIGVSLTVATPTEQLPIDFELYLPDQWLTDRKRRTEAKIPDDVHFKTKPELAVQMIRRAVKAKLPRGVVLADSAYGVSTVFRRELRRLHLDYAVGVPSDTKVFTIPASARGDSRELAVKDYALELEAAGEFRRHTWREGTGEPLRARFTRQRVLASADSHEELWLLIEWREGETEPANYFLSTLPKTMSVKRMLGIVMQRWRTERAYQDLKGELGLDHYEGRRFAGWHHHVSVALSCYAFVISERVRRFPPSAAWSGEAVPHDRAA